ncbi:TPA: DinI family protein [Salmonella enterica]
MSHTCPKGAPKILFLTVKKRGFIFVELVYDKRNFDGLPGAKNIILVKLTKRVHRLFPDADVRVKPMMTLPAINTDASKHEKEQISRTVQEMFEEADMWLVEG